MEKRVFFFLPAFILFASLLVGSHALAKERTIDPIVSTDWLEANMALEKLVIIDVRSPDKYQEGHIPNSVNIPFKVPLSDWITVRNDLLLELPEDSALFNTIGSCGIKSGSPVVIVSTIAKPPAPPYPLADATRVADTLIYAGVRNVAILDGGFPKWKAEGKPVTAKAPGVRPGKYEGATDASMFVSKEYVHDHIGKSVIIDARDTNIYFGVALEPFANKAGHIQSARSLPAPWMWRPDGTYQDTQMLSAMASGVIGKPRTKEIIVYCGVGGYTSSWWFVLTQVLKYKDVKFYDGSAQEWVRYYDMAPFRWD
jgi:thiosulfate/3-mercaptopyruvate sulfurtransferase